MPILHELIELSNELIAAVQRHDRARLEKLVAREFTLNGAAGQMDRETFMEAARAHTRSTSGPTRRSTPRSTATPPCSSPATGRPRGSAGATSPRTCT